MKISKILFFLFCFLSSLKGISQKDSALTAVKDSVYVPDTSQFKSDLRKKFSLRWHTYPHSPLRATIYSAVLPGAGQVYNGYKKEGSFLRKYWKVGVVYVGLATCAGFIDYNTKQYHKFLDKYVAYADGDLSTVPDPNYSSGWLKDTQEQYHRWMDVSYMCLFGVYVLQIVDANVDAHLFYFDVGDDLTLNIHPSFINTGHINPALGVTFGF